MTRLEWMRNIGNKVKSNKERTVFWGVNPDGSETERFKNYRQVLDALYPTCKEELR